MRVIARNQTGPDSNSWPDCCKTNSLTNGFGFGGSSRDFFPVYDFQVFVRIRWTVIPVFRESGNGWTESRCPFVRHQMDGKKKIGNFFLFDFVSDSFNSCEDFLNMRNSKRSYIYCFPNLRWSQYPGLVSKAEACLFSWMYWLQDNLVYTTLDCWRQVKSLGGLANSLGPIWWDRGRSTSIKMWMTAIEQESVRRPPVQLSPAMLKLYRLKICGAWEWCDSNLTC